MAMGDVERIVDGDGHVLEDKEAIKRYLPAAWQGNTTTRTLGVFPHPTTCTTSWRTTRPAPSRTPARRAGCAFSTS